MVSKQNRIALSLLLSSASRVLSFLNCLFSLLICRILCSSSYSCTHLSIIAANLLFYGRCQRGSDALLDTMVLSELRKRSDPTVVAWLENNQPARSI